ncbi:MAG: 3-aminobutyryl-CoA ammonia-lyase, partial [uncultured Actinomycetospora sp.]
EHARASARGRPHRRPPALRLLRPRPLRRLPRGRRLRTRVVRRRRHRAVHPQRRRRGVVRLLLRGPVPRPGARRGLRRGDRDPDQGRHPVADHRLPADRRRPEPPGPRRLGRRGARRTPPRDHRDRGRRRATEVGGL